MASAWLSVPPSVGRVSSLTPPWATVPVTIPTSSLTVAKVAVVVGATVSMSTGMAGLPALVLPAGSRQACANVCGPSGIAASGVNTPVLGS